MDESKSTVASEKATPERRGASPQRAAWLKRQRRKLMLLRACIVVLMGMILVVGIMLLVLPMLRVNAIEVVGNTVTSREEILEASGVQIGDELLGVDWQEVARRIETACPVRVKLKIVPGKLTVEVTERELLCYQYADRWFSLDRELRVLTTSEQRESYVGLMEIRLPAVASVTVGEPVSFYDDTVDRGYIAELIGFLEAQSLIGRVNLLDVAEKYHVSFVREGTIRIVLGKTSDLAEKLDMVETLLSGKDGGCAVVDVSDLSKPTYRPVSAEDLLKN